MNIKKQHPKIWNWLLVVGLCCWFTSCQTAYTISGKKANYYAVDKSKGVDLEIVEMIAPYKQELDAAMKQVIGESTTNLKKAQPEGTLNNFMADAIIPIAQQLYKNATIDFSVANIGGIRVPNLPKGKITKEQIFEVMPFDNQLVVLQLNGKVVKKLMEHIASKGGWPVSKEVKLVINNQELVNSSINEQAIDTTKTYHVLAPDYIANGGSKCYMLVDQPREDLNILFRAALIQFIEQETGKGNKINATLDKRISYGK